MKKQQGFAGIFILLILALAIAGGAYYLGTQKGSWKTQEATNTTSTTNQTADWKTYTDPRQDFSFKYPQDWSTRLHTLSNYSPFFESLDIAYDKISGRTTKGSFAVIYWKPESKTLDQLEQEAKAYKPPAQSDAPETITIERIKVNNEDALKVLSSEAPGPLTLNYTFIQNNQAVYTTCTYLETDLRASAICETILSTFKFTPQ